MRTRFATSRRFADSLTTRQPGSRTCASSRTAYLTSETTGNVGAARTAIALSSGAARSLPKFVSQAGNSDSADALPQAEVTTASRLAADRDGCLDFAPVPPSWTVRPVREDERARLTELLARSWASSTIVSRGRARDAARLAALVYVDGEDMVGLATHEPMGDDVELVTVAAFRREEGSTALVEAVVDAARQGGARRVRLITSNDNLDALRFYQRRGFRLAAIHCGAIDQARKIKPSIPTVGDYGIPVHNEVELALAVTPPAGGDAP
jgi:ribosomal protein S18 acetylase RimI-like enzyme